MKEMTNDPLPVSSSHRTFTFGAVVIDSNFDSGNCSHAEKVSDSKFNIWIGVDHPKNKYRTWFYFSVSGAEEGKTLSFKIMNMQNQSRLLNEGLVPVYREESSNEWARIKDKVNPSSIEWNQGSLSWVFNHTITSKSKVYFAFFYPWSNQDNFHFLNSLRNKAKEIPDIYFYWNPISKSMEGRPIEFLVISSKKHKQNYEEKIEDENLFPKVKKPFSFAPDKKAIVISARVHPGEVPGSHVMTGFLNELLQTNGFGKLLRDEFVFYVFPILNPDGVGRGHYRVDTNGINLNRCYLAPSAKKQPSIYAIRKIIMHLNSEKRFFAFLDLHAHAAKKGTFIYGNYTSELLKQIDTCLFPKILSLNSEDFEYEASNFTQKNMYCKERGDHMSKEGSGRVAIFKATKNPFCWTLQCNYNMSKLNNILESRRKDTDQSTHPKLDKLDEQLIVQYRQPPKRQAKCFFTIKTYHLLGKEICESFLELIGKNPFSRIDNPNSYFKSVQNLRMNLGISLMRMAPNRFQPHFKKIYYALANNQNPQTTNNALKALFLTTIKKIKIPEMKTFLREGDTKKLDLQSTKKLTNGTKSRYNSLMDKFPSRKGEKFQTSREQERMKKKEEEFEGPMFNMNAQCQNDSEQSFSQIEFEKKVQQKQVLEESKSQLKEKIVKKKQYRVSVKVEEFRMIGLNQFRKSTAKEGKDLKRISNQITKVNIMAETKNVKVKTNQLPSLGAVRIRNSLMKGMSGDNPLLRKGNSAKQSISPFA